MKSTESLCLAILSIFIRFHCKSRAVKATEDYQIRTRSENGSTTPLRLPVSNVIKYVFENDSWIVLRPSGTEPKLKIYIGVVDSSMDRATLQNRALTEAILKIVKQIA